MSEGRLLSDEILHNMKMAAFDPAREGYVYFIQCETTGRVKIGFTKGDPKRRLANLQVGSPTRLRIVRVELGTDLLERSYHAAYRKHRLHGEWFNERVLDDD